jgi:hypothetical protein
MHPLGSPSPCLCLARPWLPVQIMGGTMRLGARKTVIPSTLKGRTDRSIASLLYGVEGRNAAVCLCALGAVEVARAPADGSPAPGPQPRSGPVGSACNCTGLAVIARACESTCVGPVQCAKLCLHPGVASRAGAHERHRHRYEVNPTYVEALSAAGLFFSGKDEKGERMEIVELPRA